MVPVVMYNAHNLPLLNEVLRVTLNLTGFQDSQPTHTLPSRRLIHTSLLPPCPILDHNGSTLTLSGKYIIILRPFRKN